MYVNMCIYEMDAIVEDDEIWHIAMKKYTYIGLWSLDITNKI